MNGLGKQARRMAHCNRGIFLGHLPRDPALRATPKGTSVASFSLVVTTPRAGQSGPERGGQASPSAWRADACCVAWAGTRRCRCPGVWYGVTMATEDL
jgi:hypothetical protein